MTTPPPMDKAKTDEEHAAWLADKIVALGDYAKEAAEMLRRWPTPASLAAKPDSTYPGWRPIESAPKNWDSVLLTNDDYVTAGFWHDGSECYGHRGGMGWFDECDRGNLLTASNIHPTHWAPLPPPPGESSGVPAVQEDATGLPKQEKP